MSIKPKMILCPYCGNTQSTPDRCDECGGRFASKALKATQISMGPWFIRDKAMPFRPGCSYETLAKMIESGKVKATTILRGPTTRQYWSLARNIAGVSHMVGYCHRCNAHVEPDDVACHDCATMFLPVEERNELGLQFASNEAAEAAKLLMKKEKAKRLDVGPIETDEQETVDATAEAEDDLSVDIDDDAGDSGLLGDVEVIAAETSPGKSKKRRKAAAVAAVEPETEQDPELDPEPEDEYDDGYEDSIDDEEMIDEPDIIEDDQEELIILDPEPTYRASAHKSAAPKKAVAEPSAGTPKIMWAMVAMIGMLTASLVYVVAENSWYARQQQANAVKMASFDERHQVPTNARVRIADTARYASGPNGQNRNTALFNQEDYLSLPTPIATEAAEAEALAKVGRPHEALIKLKEIELSIPPDQRPEAIERAIGVLEQHVSAYEVPTFFSIPVE